MQDRFGLRMTRKHKCASKQPRRGTSKRLTRAEFDALITANQEIQKLNPFGSELHRNAYEAIRNTVRRFKGIDIGDYAD